MDLNRMAVCYSAEYEDDDYYRTTVSPTLKVINCPAD